MKFALYSYVVAVKLVVVGVESGFEQCLYLIYSVILISWTMHHNTNQYIMWKYRNLDFLCKETTASVLPKAPSILWTIPKITIARLPAVSLVTSYFLLKNEFLDVTDESMFPPISIIDTASIPSSRHNISLQISPRIVNSSGFFSFDLCYCLDISEWFPNHVLRSAYDQTNGVLVVANF